MWFRDIISSPHPCPALPLANLEWEKGKEANLLSSYCMLDTVQAFLLAWLIHSSL
jgi:hypothetical protein